MRAAFHTLGCKVNQYETEVIKRQFEEGGFEIVPDNEIADVYVVNTCTVTNMADRKSRQFIRHAYKNNPDAISAVTGCYAQIKPEEVSAIEGVQIVAGTDEKGRLLDMVNDWLLHRQKTTLIKSYDDIKEYEALGEISGMDERTRAFIKIQDGCNNFCPYCIIPYARGKIRSRDKAEIVHEVIGLVEK